MSHVERTPIALYRVVIGCCGSTRTIVRSNVNATSMSSRTLTCVPRSSTVVVPSAPTMPSETITSAPRRISFCVCIRSLAPSATEPSATSAPAAGDSSVADDVSGASTDRAPSMSSALWLECAESICARPSRSPSAARNSADTLHELRSSAIRRRVRNRQTPSIGLRGPWRSAGLPSRRSPASTAVSMSISPYSSARMNVPRTISTRTPSLRKQSGVPAAGGLGSTVAGGGSGGRVMRAVTTSAVAGTAVLARARHQLASPGGGAVDPSIEMWSRASTWP